MKKTVAQTRFDRNIRFFGEEGQDRLRKARVTVVGAGGVGGHVIQQLALLGVGMITVIDKEELDETNRNRYVTALATDPIPGSRKTDLAERLAKGIDPTIGVSKVDSSFVSERGFRAIMDVDYVVGCVDREGARLILTELCAAYGRPYIDVASDIPPGNIARYGGRVCTSLQGGGCLVCLGQLDLTEAEEDLSGPDGQLQRDQIYGIKRVHLGRVGPSVASVNGVVASLAVTELMVAVTGIREPRKLLTYYGHLGKVTVSTDPPASDCYYCKGIWGTRERADVERYVRADIGKFL